MVNRGYFDGYFKIFFFCAKITRYIFSKSKKKVIYMDLQNSIQSIKRAENEQDSP